jgi:hypothetical protein
VLIAGPPPANAAEPGPGGGQDEGAAISVPIFALVAIGVIATFAIWQGVRDAHKRKAEEEQKQRELEETEDFQKYFEESENAEAPPPAGTAEPPAAADTSAPPPPTDDTATR